jgi:CTD small phosphatase-like protein 2
VNLLKNKKEISRNSSLLNDIESENNYSKNKYLNDYENNIRNKIIKSQYLKNKNNIDKQNISNNSFRSIYLSRMQTNENENRTSYRDLRKNIPNLFSSCPHFQKKNESKEKNLSNEENNIYKFNQVLNRNYDNYETNNYNINNKRNVTIIKLEDLIILEEKLYKILESFKNNFRDIRKFCVDWYTFYNYTSFKGNFEYFFQEHNQQIISHESTLLEFLSIIIIYEAFGEGNLNKNDINKLEKLIYCVHQNYLIICDYILSTISDVKGNIWVNKLQNIVLSKISRKILKNENINLLKVGNNNIMIMIKNILKIFSERENININIFTYYLKKSCETSINTLNEYFRKKINQNSYKKLENCNLKIQNFKIIHNKTLSNNLSNYNNNHLNQITNINILKNNSKINSKEKIPFLQNKKDLKKIFTLVLDLDETLISFHRDEYGIGIIKPRPYLFQFLTEMSKIYELIIFTAATKEYADPILNLIDKNQIFFDKRLYRQHTIIKDNLVIKDLSKLGRDLSKVIILDNIPQNYDLQKENGIFIRNFYGDDNDDALKELIPILIKITKYPNNDIRDELKKMKEEIFTKITTNLKL